MEYLNFDLRIDTPDAYGYPVRVTQSPMGEASASLQLAAESFDRVLGEMQQSPHGRLTKPPAQEIEVEPGSPRGPLACSP